MSGINAENLDKLIKMNNFNYNLLASNIKKLSVTFDELGELYAGKDIDFVFAELLVQGVNLDKLSKTVTSYSDVLLGVKTSYRTQDAKFQSLLNRSSAR